MIDISSKRCKFKDCSRQPSFNYVNCVPLYCSLHKEDDMINVRKNKCKIEGCNRHPMFNYPNEKIRLYCSIHKEDGMIDIRKK